MSNLLKITKPVNYKLAKLSSLSTQDTPRCGTRPFAQENPSDLFKKYCKENNGEGNVTNDVATIKRITISPSDSMKKITSNLAKMEAFYLNSSETGDYTTIKRQIKESFKNLQKNFPNENFDFITFHSIFLTNKFLSSEENYLELKFGDIEFIFWACFFIALKFEKEFHFTSLKKFSEIVGVFPKLLRKTEKYILAEVLKFRIAELHIGNLGEKRQEK